MKIVCKHCKKELVSKQLDIPGAMKEIGTILSSHIRLYHKQEAKDYQDVLNVVQIGTLALPSVIMFDEFVDLDDEKTNEIFRETYELLSGQVDDLIDLLTESEDEEEELDEEKDITKIEKSAVDYTSDDKN